MLHVKTKAIEVELSDGQKVIVHAPKTGEMGTFLRAMPALQALARSFQSATPTDGGVTGMPVNISDAELEPIFPLFAVMTNITVQEFKELPLPDGIACLQGLTLFTPKNSSAPVPTEI